MMKMSNYRFLVFFIGVLLLSTISGQEIKNSEEIFLGIGSGNRKIAKIQKSSILDSFGEFSNHAPGLYEYACDMQGTFNFHLIIRNEKRPSAQPKIIPCSTSASNQG